MKVLVACEYSGIVRDAFIAKGHDAISCDILPTESAGPHYQGDIRNIIYNDWDLLIAHPPCTYLTNAANRWLYEDCATGTAQERILKREEAIKFFKLFQHVDIPRVAIENPEPHPYVMQQVGRYHDKIQPWMFGEEEQKGICLWLKNLAPLLTTIIETRRYQKVFRTPPNSDRSKQRSKFFPGIAKAMAEQWG